MGVTGEASFVLCCESHGVQQARGKTLVQSPIFAADYSREFGDFDCRDRICVVITEELNPESESELNYAAQVREGNALKRLTDTIMQVCVLEMSSKTIRLGGERLVLHNHMNLSEGTEQLSDTELPLMTFGEELCRNRFCPVIPYLVWFNIASSAEF